MIPPNATTYRVGVAKFDATQAQDWYYRLDDMIEVDVSILELEQVPAATALMNLVILTGTYHALGVLDDPLTEYNRC